MTSIEDAQKRIEAAERELTAAKVALKVARNGDMESIIRNLPEGSVFRTGIEGGITWRTIRFFRARNSIINSAGYKWNTIEEFVASERDLGRTKVYISKVTDA